MTTPMKNIFIISGILFLTTSLFLGGEPALQPKSSQKETSKFVSQKLVWDASSPEERVSNYNVYEKIYTKSGRSDWKQIGSVTSPEFTVRNLSSGSHTFGVTAVNNLVESTRSVL